MKLETRITNLEKTAPTRTSAVLASVPLAQWSDDELVEQYTAVGASLAADLAADPDHVERLRRELAGETAVLAVLDELVSVNNQYL